MKYIKIGFWASFIVLAFSSCEDVISVEPEFAEDQMVIDAWIDNRSIPQEIKITRSQQYFDNSRPVGLDDASVSVARNDGEVFSFINQGDGRYIWSPQADEGLGDVGQTFTLQIDLGSESFTAQTTIQRVPTVDSITQEFRENEIFLDDGIYLEFFARDPSGTGDAFWVKAFKNGEFLNNASQMNLVFDAGFDAGSQLDGIIFIPPIREFINELDEDDIDTPWNPGETCKVEIHSLSLNAFNFLEIARDQINNGGNGIFSLPLANTRTNITNNSGGLEPLGLFNIAAVTSREITVE
jgi:hypothetical protein